MYSKSLVPLDGPENSERPLPHVQELAKTLGSATGRALRSAHLPVLAIPPED